ncbi:hypothetical protein COLO4_08111 [Corchorus olitorius]|uniref:Uncharacterized protein n=1 Tax=Corchorus olitorius TaxID=93759 RepID=A0A1R3KHE3_9ROSI|nr:hypothetical protein COLO4_08111 [Corchorus olitorius]
MAGRGRHKRLKMMPRSSIHSAQVFPPAENKDLINMDHPTVESEIQRGRVTSATGNSENHGGRVESTNGIGARNSEIQRRRVESTIRVDARNSKIQRRRVETINGVGAGNVEIQRGRAESTNGVPGGNSEIQRRVESTNGDGVVNAEIQGGRSQSTDGVAPSNSEFQNGAESVDGVATNVNSNNTSLTNPQKGSRGLNKGRPTPSNPSEKIELHLLDNNDFMEDGVPQDITSTARKHLNGVWPTWGQFPPIVKDSLWRRFKMYGGRGLKKASKNRNSLKEGSVTKHTAGSRSFSKWRHSMVAHIVIC